MKRKFMAIIALILAVSMTLAFTVNIAGASADEDTNSTCEPGQVCLK